MPHKFIVILLLLGTSLFCSRAIFAANDIDLLLINKTNHDYKISYGGLPPCANLKEGSIVAHYSVVPVKMNTQCTFVLDQPTLNLGISLTTDYLLIVTGCQYQKFKCFPEDRVPQDTSKDKLGVVVVY